MSGQPNSDREAAELAIEQMMGSLSARQALGARLKIEPQGTLDRDLAEAAIGIGDQSQITSRLSLSSSGSFRETRLPHQSETHSVLNFFVRISSPAPPGTTS